MHGGQQHCRADVGLHQQVVKQRQPATGDEGGLET